MLSLASSAGFWAANVDTFFIATAKELAEGVLEYEQAPQHLSRGGGPVLA